MMRDLGIQNTSGALVSPAVRAEPWPGMLRFLVSAYAALLPYFVEIRHDLNFALTDCVLLLVVLLAPGQLRFRRPAWSIWHVALIFVFAAGTLISALHTGTLNRYELLNKDVGLALLLLSYAAITSVIADWEDLRRILRIFTLGVVSQNLVAVAAFLASYFFGLDTPFTQFNGARLSGMMLDPNAYGGLLVLALVICEGSAWGPAPLFRGFPLLFCRLTLWMGILFTFSRSAWVSLAVALLLLCALRRAVAIRFAIAGLMGGSCLFVFMGRRFLEYFEHMASRPEQGDSRFVLMRDALAEFAKHPVLGGGLGNFLALETTVVHNTALWFLADFGLVGLVVLVGYLGTFFARAWFAYRFAPDRERPLMLALLLAHTAMIGLSMGIEALYQRHWWFIVALIGSAYSLTRRTAGHRLAGRGYLVAEGQ